MPHYHGMAIQHKFATHIPERLEMETSLLGIVLAIDKLVNATNLKTALLDSSLTPWFMGQEDNKSTINNGRILKLVEEEQC